MGRKKERESKKTRLICIAFILIFIVCDFIGIKNLDVSRQIAMYFNMLIGSFLIYLIVSISISRNYSGKLKKEIVPYLLKTFGSIERVKRKYKFDLIDLMSDNNSVLFTLKELSESGLFGKVSGFIVDDEYVGKYKGISFKMSEGRISTPFYSKYCEFRGLILSFELGKKAETLRITISDDIEVYSPDGKINQDFANSEFVKKFAALKIPFDAENIKLSRYENKLIVAIDAFGDFFEIGDLFNSLTDPEPIKKFYNEMNSIYEILDYLNAEEGNDNDDDNNMPEFDRMYKREVIPILEEWKEKRKKRIKKICLRALNGIVLALILIALTTLLAIFAFDKIATMDFKSFSNPILNALFSILAGLLIPLTTIINSIISVGVACFIFGLPKRIKKTSENELKENLFPILLKKFGNIVRIKESSKNGFFSLFKIEKINEVENEKSLLFTKKELKNSGLFAPFDVCRFDDAFVGTHKNIPFKFAEVKLVNILDASFDRFKGIVLSYKTGKMAEGQTIIATKGSNIEKNEYEGLFAFAFIPCILIMVAIVAMAVVMCAKMGVSGLTFPAFFSMFLFMAIYVMAQCYAKMKSAEKTKIENDLIPNNLEVYSTNKEEGERIIKSPLGQKILNLKAPCGMENIRYSFVDDDLIIAMETNKNLFEIGSLFHNLLDPKPIEKFYNEINSIYEMLEYLKIDEENSDDRR